MPLTLSGTTGASLAAQATALVNPPTLGTAVATTSGTFIDFTSIPSWVKRITTMFNGVSTSGTSATIIQMGSGSIQATGYLGAADVFVSGATNTTANMSTGFLMCTDSAATYTRYGTATLTHMGSNIWTYTNINGHTEANRIGFAAGSATFSGAVDRIRLTTVAGTDTFDAGSVNILYE